MPQCSDTISLSRSVPAGTVPTLSAKAGQKRTVLAVLAWPFKMLLKWQAHEMQRHAMSRLDRHLMNDLGLSDHDIEAALSKPFWKTGRQ